MDARGLFSRVGRAALAAGAEVATTFRDLVAPPLCLVCGRTAPSDRPIVCDACWPDPVPPPPPLVLALSPPPAPPERVDDDSDDSHEPPGTGVEDRPSTGPAPTLRIVAGHAYRGAVRELLHGLKYRRLSAVAGPLGARLATRVEVPPGTARVVAIPLHPSRRRERGFDQAALIARAFARAAGLPPPAPLLRRSRPTPTQTRMDRDERERNVAGAFDLCRSRRTRGACAGAGVLLLDDVVTTGATLSEAAAVLAGAGFAVTGAVTVALTVEIHASAAHPAHA